MSDEIKILAGVPVDDDELKSLGVVRMSPAFGSVKMPCHLCGRLTWIGLRQQAMAKADPLARVTCQRCVFILHGGRTPKIKHLGGEGGSYVMKDGTVFAPKSDN